MKIDCPGPDGTPEKGPCPFWDTCQLRLGGEAHSLCQYMDHAYLDTGRVFFHDGTWCVELAGGEQLFIERWPSCDLYCGRDDNRRAEVEVLPKPKKQARFVRFLN